MQKIIKYLNFSNRNLIKSYVLHNFAENYNMKMRFFRKHLAGEQFLQILNYLNRFPLSLESNMK
jgi:hypothetical protein